MVRKLTHDEFLATMAQPMTDIRNSGGPFVDVGPYLKEIPADDFGGFRLAVEIPDHVYLSPDKRYEQYLMPTTTRNVFMVVIADNQWQGFHGHYLLDLNREYGLEK